ncbi:D-alanyl-D-alanine carboxypeptidase [Bacillaceae bacterium SIJ1]|uniref:serine hydrolase n=1 Tax=Litoribacterium kuwaitense TaxID=1398745 RepID=UPI0013EB93A7|nr:serine hydrolase [Litoribacterium kuwaitense]NGP45187.1 D-alanyl-D-alanine carboxypeptidase [Litoribacterium kuwaitense]
MKRIKRWGLIQLIFLMSFASLIQIVQMPSTYAAGPEIEGESAVVFEAETGRILYEKNIDLTLPPASMTKMMSEFLILEAIEEGRMAWDQETTISDYAYEISQNRSLSNVPLRQGGTYNVKELYEAMAIYSANGATIALAEALEGTEGAFVKKMNERAGELGLPDYQFVNTTGLNNASLNGKHPEGTSANADNMLSARSTAILAHHLITEYPEVLETSSIARMTFREGTSDAIDMINWNRMLPGLNHEYEGVDGLKTGYTDLAGACFTGTAERNGVRLISVVMKTSDNDKRFEETAKLLDYGFNQFEKTELYPAGYTSEEKQSLPVHQGKEEAVGIATNAPLTVVTSKDEKVEDVFKPVYQMSKDNVAAPVEEGAVVGQMTVEYSGDIDYGFIQGPEQSFASVDVVTQEPVEKANWFVLTFRAIGSFFAGLWETIVSGISGLFS